MDPIVKKMVEDAQAGGVINLRAHLTDRTVIKEMIERSGMDRRQHPRPGRSGRRQEDES